MNERPDGDLYTLTELLLIGIVTALLMITFVGCVVEGPTKPSPVPPSRAAGSLTVMAGASAKEIQGGKACVLTPADPTLIPVGHYACPNGVTFDQPCPSTGCPRVAPQPKH